MATRPGKKRCDSYIVVVVKTLVVKTLVVKTLVVKTLPLWQQDQGKRGVTLT